MYHVAICDDEPIYLHHISRLIGEIFIRYDIPYTLEIFRSIRELRSYLNENPNALDLLLLDILMGEENGLDFAGDLRREGNRIDIILITSSSDFLLDGYSISPVGYVLKSSEQPRLEDVVLRAYRKFQNQSFLIRTPSSTTVLRAAEILYVEVNNKELTVHLEQQKAERLTCSLNVLVSELPPGQFFQCHRSYVVSLAAIRSLRKHEVVLKNEEAIPVSRSKFLPLQRALLNWAVNL